MESEDCSVPNINQVRYIGEVERVFILAGYCLFALFTSTVMLVANILLYALEQGLEWFKNICAIPNKVSDQITKRNQAIIDAQNDTK
jgi:hypothetical protein